MGLPWVRLDANISTHDKILYLASDPSAARWQAAFSYVCAIGWSGDQGTDGRISQVALPFVHGTATTARLLVKYQLWDEGTVCDYLSEEPLTFDLTDREFDALVREIRKACVTVTWDDE